MRVKIFNHHNEQVLENMINAFLATNSTIKIIDRLQSQSVNGEFGMGCWITITLFYE